MQIELVSATLENKGKYNQLLVAYRNNGKLAEKKLMSFGEGVAAFEFFQKAVPGSMYDVETRKNDKGFWDWISAAPAGEVTKTAATTTPSPAKTFETAEERALRQKYIIRQSSIANALDFLKHQNPTETFTMAQVVEVADRFQNYVYGLDFTGLEDDIPL